MALENKQKVLVVKCPSDNKEQKQFLGYEWSSTKGNEGIKYVNQSSVAAEIEDVETKELVQKISGLHNINTPLYNPNNRNDPSKINHYIQESFLGNELAIAAGLQPFIAYHNLADMLDFSRVNFNKQINLSTNKKASLSTKWQTVNLGTIADVKIGGTPSRESADYFNGDNLWVSISEMKGQIITDTKEKISDAGVKKSNVKLIPRGTTLLSFKLSIGKTAIAGKDLYTNEAIAGLIPKDKNIITDEYLYQIFSAKQIDLESTGSKMFGKSLNSDYLKNDVKIPLPPKEIQQKIVDECAVIDNQAQKAAAEIEKAKTEIKSIINNQLLVGKTKKLADLLDINKFTKDPTQKPDKEFIYVDIESVGKGTGFVSYEQKILGANAPSRARRLAPKGSTIISTVRPNLKGFAFIEKEVEDSIFSTGFAILQSKDEKQLLNKVVYFAFQHSNDLMKQMEASEHGGSYPSINKNDIENLKIPVPPIAEQEKLVNQIEKLEQIIAKNQAKIDNAPNNKKAVMKSYL